MAVSPSDPNTLVLGTTSGLYRSTDGGKTWLPTGPKNVNATSVAAAGSTILAGGVASTPTTSPVIRVGAARAAANGAAVLAASTDGGMTWKTLHPTGLPSVSVQAIAVDPANSSTVYLLTNNGKFYRSTDGASSFQLVSAKLGIPPWAFAVTQNSHFVGGDMDSGPHQSANGKAWQPTVYTDARGTHMVMEYAVAPKDTTKILMTSYRHRPLDRRRQDLAPGAEVVGDVRAGRLGAELAANGLRGRLRRLDLAFDRRRHDLDAGLLRGPFGHPNPSGERDRRW